MIAKLFQKQKEGWLLLILGMLFFFIRFPSLFEPYWYGDEGIYEVIGKALRSGRILYQGIWDNKPPVLYILYAIADADQFIVRAMSLIAGLLAVISFYYLSRMLFTNRGLNIVLTAVFAFLFATPILEGNIANAENFMLFPIITGGFLLYRYMKKMHHERPQYFLKQNLSLFFSGLLIGVAFLTKTVAIFDFSAFLLFIFFLTYPKKNQFSVGGIKNGMRAFFMIGGIALGGFLLPLGITVLYFLFHGALFDFLSASFFTNIGYVSYGNSLIIPQGYVLVKLLLLLVALFIIFMKRNRLSHEELFVLLWVTFSVFSVFFSQRPYTHYVLMGLPSLVLLLGLIFSEKKRQLLYIFLSAILFFLVIFYFRLNNRLNILPYYKNFISYLSGRKDTVSYRSFFDKNTPRDYEVASYIKTNLKKKNSPIFVWGNSAQIYPLSQTLPPGRYTVAYHIIGNQKRIDETAKAMHTNPPSFVILLPDYSTYPFSLNGYVYRGTVEDTAIYERGNE